MEDRCTTTPADAPIRWVDIDGVVYDDPAARETNISSAPDLGIDVQPECQLADGSDSLAGETVVINSRFEDTVINLSPELFAGHVTSNNEETCFGPIQNSNGPITAQIDSELNILSVINQYDFDTNTGVCITESVADTQDQPDVVMGKSYYDPTRQGASPALDGGGSPIVLFGPLQLDQEVQLSNSIFLIGPATQSGGLGSPNVLQGAQVALGNGESLTTSIDDTDCLVTESRRFTARFCQDVDGMIVFMLGPCQNQAQHLLDIAARVIALCLTLLKPRSAKECSSCLLSTRERKLSRKSSMRKRRELVMALTSQVKR